MASRVSLNSDLLTYERITKHHERASSAISHYFACASGEIAPGATIDEMNAFRDAELTYQEEQDALVLLTFLESIFRVDFNVRCQRRLRDKLSRDFRETFKKSGSRVSLDDEILKAWVTHGHIKESIADKIRASFKYRHWLAHGRYWVPKFGGRISDFYELCSLVEALLESVTFKMPDQ